MDHLDEMLAATSDALPVLRNIAIETVAGRTYVVRARAWVRTDPDVPFGHPPPSVVRSKLAVLPIADRCDVVWAVDEKTKTVVACSVFPDGCMLCDDALAAR